MSRGSGYSSASLWLRFHLENLSSRWVLTYKIQPVPISTEDKLIPISTEDTLLPISTEDKLLPISTEDKLLPISTEDKLLRKAFTY